MFSKTVAVALVRRHRREQSRFYGPIFSTAEGPDRANNACELSSSVLELSLPSPLLTPAGFWRFNVSCIADVVALTSFGEDIGTNLRLVQAS